MTNPTTRNTDLIDLIDDATGDVMTIEHGNGPTTLTADDVSALWQGGDDAIEL